MTTMTLQPIRIAPAWRGPGLAIVTLIALLMVSYRGTGIAMWDIWSRSETFAHAFVVPPIFLWLVWRQRAVLGGLQPRPVPWMVLPMALLAAIWWLGDAVSVNAVTQLAFTAMLVAAVPAVLGWQVTRALLFPLAFLFFAVPIGEFMTPTLMHYTADFTVFALQLSGIPIYREGQQFVIPSGHWSVIDECSGIRYLMASFMVGSLFAYLNYRSTTRRLVFVGFSIVVPIVANWLRAYLIVMLAHLSGNRLATGVDHILYGWVFFGIVIMALFFIGARWAEPDPQGLAAPGGRIAASDVGARHAAWQAMLVAGLALAVTQLPHLLQRHPAELGHAPMVALPDTLAPGWHTTERELSAWRPVYVGASVEADRTYAAPEGQVAVHLAYYRDQTDNSKLVSSVNVLVPMRNSPWNQLATGSTSTALRIGTIEWRTAKLIEAEAASGPNRQRLTVWRSYWIGGQLTANDMVAKLQQARLRVSGEPDDAAELMLYTDASSDADAEQLLNSFLGANFDVLQRILADARMVR